MDKVLEVAANQVPSLVVLVVVVIVFLRAGRQQSTEFSTMLKDQRGIFIDALKSRDMATEEIAERCHAVTAEASSAVRENSRALGSIEKTMEQTGRALQKALGL